MGVTGQHVHGLDLFSGDFEVQDLVAADAAFLDERLAADDDEELPFGVVPVLAFRDAGVGDVHAELAAGNGLQELRKAPAGIGVHLEREGHLFGRQIAQEGRIQLLREATGGDFRDKERLALLFELFQEVHDFAQGGSMSDRTITVAANLVILRRIVVILRRSRRI